MDEEAKGHAIAMNAIRWAGGSPRARAERLQELHQSPALKHFCDKCGSPVEAALGLALSAICALSCTEWAGIPDGFRFGKATLRQQVKIGSYRVDFLLSMQGVEIVAECDGHAFHDRTAEQAQRDKLRDRWLQTAGYQVLRFTGSEVWRDAADCAVQVYDALEAALRRQQ